MVMLESEMNVKLMHAFDRTNRVVFITSDSARLESSSDQSQIVCNIIMRPSYSFRTLPEEDFASLHPEDDLIKKALDYLLSSLNR